MKPARKRTKTYPSFISLDHIPSEEDCSDEIKNNRHFNQTVETENRNREADEVKNGVGATRSVINVIQAETMNNFNEIELESHHNEVLEEDVQKRREKTSRVTKPRLTRQAPLELERSPRVAPGGTLTKSYKLSTLTKDSHSAKNFTPKGGKTALAKEVVNKVVKTEFNGSILSPRGASSKALVPSKREDIRSEFKTETISNAELGSRERNVRVGRVNPSRNLVGATRENNKPKHDKSSVNRSFTHNDESGEKATSSKIGKIKGNLARKSSKTEKNHEDRKKEHSTSISHDVSDQPKSENDIQIFAKKSTLPKLRPLKGTIVKKSGQSLDIKGDDDEANEVEVVKDTEKKGRIKRQLSDVKDRKVKKIRTSIEQKSITSTSKASPVRKAENAVKIGIPRGPVTSKKIKTQEDKARLKQFPVECADVGPSVADVDMKVYPKKRPRRIATLDVASTSSTNFSNGPEASAKEQISTQAVRKTRVRTSKQGAADTEAINIDDLRKTGAIPKTRNPVQNYNTLQERVKSFQQTPVKNATPQKPSLPPSSVSQRKMEEKKVPRSQLWDTPKRATDTWSSESILLMVIEAMKQQAHKPCSVQSMKSYIKGLRGMDVPNYSLKKALQIGLVSHRLGRPGKDKTPSLTGSYTLQTDTESSNLAAAVLEVQPPISDIPDGGKTVKLEAISPIKKTRAVRTVENVKGAAASKGTRRMREYQKTPLMMETSNKTSTPLADQNSVLNVTFVLSPIAECKSDTEDNPKVSRREDTKIGRRRSKSDSVCPRNPKVLSASAVVRKKNKAK